MEINPFVVAACLSVAAGTSCAQTASPPVIKAGRGFVTPALPGTPIFTLNVRYKSPYSWPGEKDVNEDIKRLASPEAADVLAVNQRISQATVKSTWKGFYLLQNRDLFVVDMPADPARTDCTGVFLTFDLGPVALPPRKDTKQYPERECPDAREILPEQQLVIEGVDQSGATLFVVVSDDPRWHIYEGANAQGNLELLKRGRDDVADTYVTFDAPIDARLKTVRIWQVEDDGTGAVIATVKWPAPSQTKQ